MNKDDKEALDVLKQYIPEDHVRSESPRAIRRCFKL